MGTCIKCKRRVDEDNFCHGCQSYVCDSCDAETEWSVADAGFGPHEPEDHFTPADDEGG